MNNLYIKQVPGKGRCVFSKKDIKTGEIVETAPVIIISGNLYDLPEKHEYRINGVNELVRLKEVKSDSIILPQQIANVTFNWSNLINDGKKDQCIALGYGSLYSSNNPANMKYEADEKNLNLLFIAVVDIPKNTELTVNYSGINGSHISKDNNWFTNRKIDFIE